MVKQLRWVALAVLVAGCDDAPAPPAPPPVPVVESRHDPATAGTVRGRVTWDGAVPKLAPVIGGVPNGAGAYRWGEFPAAFAPVVDPKTRGLSDAVVYLKGVEPELAPPWYYSAVDVELGDFRIRIRQGKRLGRVGLVRCGGTISATSFDEANHMLRARGAAFFTLPFPDPGKPLTRVLRQAGLVELSSGAGHSWAAADLFVCEHPYYAVTDTLGQFWLPGVPPGKYELMCWVRNWHVAGHERDPETGLVFRVRYAPALVKHAWVTVPARGTAEQAFAVTAAEFPAK